MQGPPSIIESAGSPRNALFKRYCESAQSLTVPRLRKIGRNKYKFEGVTQEGATVDAILTMRLRRPGVAH